MKADLDLYVANSGPYRLAFVSAQIASALPSPSFDLGGGARPGVLGAHGGMSVIHPGWLWGETPAQTQPRYLLVTRSGRHALAVDSYRLQRHSVEPPPAALAGQGMVFGIVQTAEGVLPVLDLARLPLA